MIPDIPRDPLSSDIAFLLARNKPLTALSNAPPLTMSGTVTISTLSAP